MGLSLAKLGALRHLALADEPLTLTQLAERHCCGRSNVTALIDRLEADGLVARAADPAIAATCARRSPRRVATRTARQRDARRARAVVRGRLGHAPRAELARGLRALREG